MDFRQALNQLIYQILNTNEFVSMKNAKNNLKQNQEVYKRFLDFEQTQGMLYKENISQNEYQQLMNKLNQDYEYLNRIPEANRYFQLSEQFNNIIAQIMQEIHKQIDSAVQN